MLRVKNLAVRGLRPISLALKDGECLAVRGPSGSGKSLFLRALADLDEVAGEVRLDGQGRFDMAATDWRSRLRYLAAESGWWREVAGEHFRDIAKAGEMAARLGLDPELLNAPIAHLSSGERQRLAFIRALEGAPRVLLLDEPTAALDEKSAAVMEREISSLKERGRIIIIVTHSPAQAQRLADRVLTIENGQWRLERP